jgi:hypothetical protein
MIRRLVLLAAVPLALSACATNQGVQGASIGAGAGALAGAVIGNNVGSGNAQTGALIAAGITPTTPTIPSCITISIRAATGMKITATAPPGGKTARGAPLGAARLPTPCRHEKGGSHGAALFYARMREFAR